MEQWIWGKVRKFWPVGVIVLITLIFYYPVWWKHLIPFPGDITVGAYYPWFDYKWLGYDAGVPVKNPLISDVPSVIYPERLLAIEQIKFGIMPLWNNLIFSGYPLMATFQSAVFYPLNFLYALMPMIDAWSWQVILQTPLAMGLTYLFLRSLKLSKLSALLGGIIYAFSGFMMFWLEYNVHGHVAAMIPLLLLLAEKYAQSRRVIYLGLLSLVIAIQIFAGYPQVVIYSILTLSVWMAYRLELWKRWREDWWRMVVFGLFVVLGLGIAGVQLVPGQELFKLSQRVSEDVPIDLRLVQPQLWVTVIFPTYFGASSHYNYWGAGDFTNTLGFGGIVTFVLAWVGLIWFKSRSEVRFFTLLLIFCLLVISDTPVNRFLMVNVLDKLSGSTKAMTATRAFVFVNLSLAVLASFGLEILKTASSKRQIVRILYLPIAIIAAVVLGTAFSAWILKSHVGEFVKQGRSLVDINYVASNYQIAFRSLAIGAATVGASLAAIFWILVRPKQKMWGIVALVFLVSYDMFSYGWKITPFSEKGFVFPSTPILSFLQNLPKPNRFLETDVIPSNMWMPYHLETPSGYDAVYPLVQAKLMALVNNPLDPDTKPMLKVGKAYKYHSRLLDLANTKYFLSHKYTPHGEISPTGQVSYFATPDKFTKVFEDRSVAVLENKTALARAFMVTEWDSVQTDHQLFVKLLDENYPFEKRVILHQPFSRFNPSLGNHFAVDYVKYAANQSLIKVTTVNDGLLFISDTFYPGWKAEVDGVAESILQADYAFRAIPVRAGSHLVRMYYQPESFKIGLKITIVSFAILMTVFGWLGLRINNKRLRIKD